MERRFFVDPDQINAGKVVIRGNEGKHIATVLRMAPGDSIILLDGHGQEYQACLERVSRDEVIATINSSRPVTGEPPCRLTLLQGIPKKDLMDLIIQKGTEIGVSRFMPLYTENTIVQWEAPKARRQQERWQRIALEAAKQSRRGLVPVVEEPAPLVQCLKLLAPATRTLLFWEEPGAPDLRQAIQSEAEYHRPAELAMMIGPEGGWSAAEVALVCQHGAQPVSLGPRILRTETAALVGAALLLYAWGDLGGAK